MADHRRNIPPSADWSAAFAALPLETPPARSWERVAAALPKANPPVTRRKPSPMHWALAATLATVATGAWVAMSAYSESQPASDHAPRGIASGDSGAASHPDEVPAPRGAPAGQPRPVGDAAAIPSAGALATAAVVDPAGPRSPVGKRANVRSAPGRRAHTPVYSANVRMPGTNDSAAPSADPASRIEPATESSLTRLHGESARLEALVAMSRNEQVQNGVAAVLAAEVNDRLRLIDAALSQPRLGDDDRLDLWNTRVAALGELAGIEGTQRWMSAQGIASSALARVD